MLPSSSRSWPERESTWIGAATCKRFAAAGARCVVADVADGRELAAAIDGEYRAVDVSDAKAVDQLIASTLDSLGSIDILVNNAGVLGPAGARRETDANRTRSGRTGREADTKRTRNGRALGLRP